MYPGKMNLPAQSITRASFGALTVFALPAAAILSPPITTVAFGNTLPSAGLITVAPTSVIFSAWAASAKIESAQANAILGFIATDFSTRQNKNEPVISAQS